MNVDKDRMKSFINAAFITYGYRIDITEFDSGAMMIDVFREKDFINIQYGLTFIGVSIVPDDDPAAGFTLPDEVFYTVHEFEDCINKMEK